MYVAPFNLKEKHIVEEICSLSEKKMLGICFPGILNWSSEKVNIALIATGNKEAAFSAP